MFCGDIVKDKDGSIYLIAYYEYGSDMELIDENREVISKSDNAMDLFDEVGIDLNDTVKIGELTNLFDTFRN